MARELVDSRSSHITMSGQTLTQKWLVLWGEIEVPIASGLPVIGTQWTQQRPDLCASDIQVLPVPDNDKYAHYTVTYSTSGKNWPERLPDTIASIQQVFDFQMTPGISDSYFDYGDDASASWAKKWDTSWKAANPGTSPESTPPRVREEATTVMTITANVSFWSWAIVQELMGYVNSEHFFEIYRGRHLNDQLGNQIDVENIGVSGRYNDTGKWLFAGFRAEQVGRAVEGGGNLPNYEITSTFLYEKDGWNTIYGVTGYKAYQTTTFAALPKPTGSNARIDMGQR